LPNRKVYKGILFLIPMPIKIKKLSEVVGKRVYTDSGDYFGEIEEVNLVENKVDSWRIKVAGGIGNFLGGARGVVIPHQFVKAIGDVCVVSRSSLPLQEESEESIPEEEIEL
jgi:sporulation protein YlmC with PRC-barrel domain